MSSPQIFISYSSKDRKIVEQIHEILTSLNNFSLWRDQNFISAKIKIQSPKPQNQGAVTHAPVTFALARNRDN